MNLRTSSRLPLLILALILVILYSPLFYGQTFFWGLPSLQFVPWRRFAVDAGQFPFWNPYNGAGTPLIANYQSALFYPLNWLSLILPTPWAMSVIAVAHLFIAGWGMWSYAGRLGLPSVGRGVSTLAFGLCAYLVARIETFPIITAVAWLPWLMWAAHGLVVERRIRSAAWLAVFAALLLLAGHAQTAWYSLILVGSSAMWWLIRRRTTIRYVLYAGGAILLGAMIAAPQMLPTAELLGQSQRAAGVDYVFAMNFSYSPARMLNMIAPNVFGTPADGSYVTQGAYFEDAVYIGLIPLVSAIAAVIGWVRIRHTPERSVSFSVIPFLGLTAVGASTLALGRYTPIFPFLYDHIPTFDIFQAPVRWHLLTVFSLSVLAGIGTQMWGRSYWILFATRLATAGSIGLVVLSLVVAPRVLPSELVGNPGVGVLMKALATTGMLGALAGLLTLAQPERRTGLRYGVWTLVVFAVIGADLAGAARGLNPMINSDFYTAGATGDIELTTGRSYWPLTALNHVKYERFLPFKDYRVVQAEWAEFRASGLPNLNILDRQPLLNNFEPLLVGHFDRWIDLIEDHPSRQQTLLLASGVNSVYDRNGILTTFSESAPRAWFVSDLCWHHDDASLVDGLLAADWNPYEQAHVPGDGGCGAPSRTANRVVMLQDQLNTLTITVETPEDGWLIVADTDYPGWSASVDGERTYIYRANLAFRAVQVLRGAQTIQFEYQAWWLLPGTALMAIGLLITLALFRSQSSDDFAITHA